MAKAKKSIKGTKTEANLVKAYISESAAYTRYTYYAKQADKEEYYPIGQVFRETAENEIHHGKVFFKLLEGGKVNVTIDPDAGVIGNTAENLATAAAEEEAEGIEQYIAAAKVADEEGFTKIAEHFRAIAEIEKRHREHFLWYLDQVKKGTVWKRKKPSSGSAWNVATNMKVPSHRLCARHATIHTSTTWPWTSNKRSQTYQ